MAKKVVLVGHCGADSAYLRIAVGNVQKGISVIAADDQDSLKKALAEGADLLLLNRRLDWGFHTDEGIELIRSLRMEHPDLRMMLVSNYEEAQAAAVQAGALPGFGKRELGSAKVTELLRGALE